MPSMAWISPGIAAAVRKWQRDTGNTGVEVPIYGSDGETIIHTVECERRHQNSLGPVLGLVVGQRVPRFEMQVDAGGHSRSASRPVGDRRVVVLIRACKGRNRTVS
jgi:hypothetical protein